MQDAPLTLYGSPVSGHALRVEQLLLLLGLDYRYIEVSLPMRKMPEFLAMNPLGQIPVLVDGDLVLADSNAIMVYLVRRYAPSSQWLPADPVRAAKVQRWFSIAAGELAFGPAAARYACRTGRQDDQQRACAIAVRVLPMMDAHLSTQAFLAGELATLADLACYAYVALAPEGGLPLATYPHLRKWIERLEALPRFKPIPRQ